MTGRKVATPAGIRLCLFDDLPEPGARGFTVETAAGPFQGFAVRKHGKIHGFVDRCPHMGLPLAWKPHAYLTPRADFMMCSRHGALFTIEDGRCVGGPCVGYALARWPLEICDGWVVTL
ncbi:MAG: Rieske 2Fe-2S domain-containing protein [Sphingopyxis sp.]|nr:Rieske 2Fe-2S domain-containing protein [Sphingopyxis sp.]